MFFPDVVLFVVFPTLLVLAQACKWTTADIHINIGMLMSTILPPQAFIAPIDGQKENKGRSRQSGRGGNPKKGRSGGGGAGSAVADIGLSRTRAETTILSQIRQAKSVLEDAKAKFDTFHTENVALFEKCEDLKEKGVQLASTKVVGIILQISCNCMTRA